MKFSELFDQLGFAIPADEYVHTFAILADSKATIVRYYKNDPNSLI